VLDVHPVIINYNMPDRMTELIIARTLARRCSQSTFSQFAQSLRVSEPGDFAEEISPLLGHYEMLAMIRTSVKSIVRSGMFAL
jgi:hypothetical protein